MNIFKKLAALLLFAAFSTAACAVATSAQVFAWAEATYPQFFSGTPVAAQFPPYTLQYYPGSQTFLAIDTSGNVYVYGPVTGNTLANVGTVASFSPAVTTWETERSAVGGFAGTYIGNYYWTTQSGTGSGPWTITISSSGAVTGQGSATCTGTCDGTASYPLSGSLSASGAISFTTSGGDVCSGTLTAGSLSGTCNYVFNQSSGSFSGTQQTQTAFSIPVSVTGSTNHVTSVQVCVTVSGNDTCGPSGGFAVGQSGTIAGTTSSGATSYIVTVPSNQPAAAVCSVTSGGSGSLGTSNSTAVVTCS